MLPETMGEDGADQRGEGAENNVRQCAPCEQVGQKTTDGNAGDGGRCKEGEDGQHLGEPHLDGTACQIKAGGKLGQNNVEGGDEGSLDAE